MKRMTLYQVKSLRLSAIVMALLMYSIFILGCSIHRSRIIVSEKSRVIVLTDMLNEADDSQTMVHLLMYANKMDIEGLIAVSSCHQYAGKNDPIEARNNVHPGEIVKMINAYGRVGDNLTLHEKEWPTVEYLLSVVGSGPAGYGMSAVGGGKTTSGSQLIMDAVLKNDPRPLYICINAGANCLAQALFDLSSRMDRIKLNVLLAKVRVYDDAGQDDAGAWIAKHFPVIRYQRSQSQVFNFMNGRGPVTWDKAEYAGWGQYLWAKQNIQTGHGPLGELYPTRMQWKRPDLYHTLEGGGTSTWIGHVNQGLYVPEQITWGGWGGRFAREKSENVLADQLKSADLVETENPHKPFYMYPEAKDKWTDPETDIEYNEAGTPIYRWRRAYQNDFQARMDWCVMPFEQANHNPVAVFNGDITDGVVYYSVYAGDLIPLDASASYDPDGDNLLYRWLVYPEAGDYSGDVNIEKENLAAAKIVIPADASGRQIHLILEVRDQNNIVSLYDYRRIVFRVEN